jgi:beta-galactosidase
MKSTRKILGLILGIIPLSTFGLTAKENTEINTGWKFHKTNIANAYQDSFDDSGWDSVVLPHTWNGFDGKGGDGSYYRGVGWYRKQIDIPASFAGKAVYLNFGAANMTTTAYINGIYAGTHTGGYASFMFDITGLLKTGQKNRIAVKVNNSDTIISPPISGGFVYCGGITRGAELIVLNPVHINRCETIDNTFTSGEIQVAQPGVLIRQNRVSETFAGLDIRVLLKNITAKTVSASVKVKIKDAEGKTVKSLSTPQTIPAKGTGTASLETGITRPHLWDGVNDPYLYRVEVEVDVAGKVADSSVQPLGLRYFRVDPDRGFFLNGKSYPLRGISLHEDREGKSRALSDSERKEDLDLLLETGANYLRLAHYQHGDFTYHYLDSLGIICWTEIPAVGEVGTPSQNPAFRKYAASQMYELLRQQYNHPSVIFWGLCNEIYGVWGREDPTPTIRLLNEIVKSEDTYRVSTLASACHDDQAEKPGNFIPDAFGCNRYDGWYYHDIPYFATAMDDLHRKYPDAKLGVSEYGAGANISHHLEPAERPVTAGQFHPEEYQNLFHEAYLKMINERPYIWGTSIWAGFDFEDIRNEGGLNATNDKGLITRDRRVKKDAFYLYKANWNKKERFVYITGRRYTERDSPVVPVKIYSNCEKVALKVNGVPVGEKTAADHIFLWENIRLKEGENRIEASGISGETSSYDVITWKNSI